MKFFKILSERTNTKEQSTVKSSYYSLTPASSTTSLADLANNAQANENFAKAKRLASNGRKRTRLIEQQQPPLMSNTTQKRRGRPAKSQPAQSLTQTESNRIDKYLEVKQPQQQSHLESHLESHIESQSQIESQLECQEAQICAVQQTTTTKPAETAKTSNCAGSSKPKLIKSLIKKTGSNLQKSKVLNTSPPIDKLTNGDGAKPTETVLATNANCLNLPNVNTKQSTENFQQVTKVIFIPY